MTPFYSFVLKETKHILRDKRTVLVLFGMPVVMMLLFGFALSTDIKNVQTVVVCSSWDNQTRKLVEQLNASEYFTIVGSVSSTKVAEQLIRKRKADMAIAFSPGFANYKYDGVSSVQLILDASDPNTALIQSRYAKMTLIGNYKNTPVVIHTKMLYNPQMKSSYSFVPGIMGMLLLLICTMMTSVSIVREKERGTMEVLLVSPVKPIMIIVAKAIPYFVLALLILICILLLSAYVLGVPISGSLFWILSISMIYILLALSLGLLVSTVAKTQLVALLASAMLLLMPTLLLSGMIYPIESMPTILQWVSCLVPARWYISAMRKLMIMGVGITSVLQEVMILITITVVLLGAALKNFKYRL